MKTYRIRLKPRGSFKTPVHADTLFGHLCWIVKWTEGDEALKNLLEVFGKDPPFILSDGFPGDFLPAPVHLPRLAGKDKEGRDAYRAIEKSKAIKWLTADEFSRVQAGMPVEPPEEHREGFRQFTTLHNSISRLTGTTGEEGSLFEVEEYALDGKCGHITVYAKIRDGWEERFKDFFGKLSMSGYGKKKSVGMGAFEVMPLESFTGFDAQARANGFMALSNFVPAKDDPVEGRYGVLVKYGKLGGEFSFSGKPFKKPLMMIKAGSVFRCVGLKPYYGRLVRGLSEERPEAVNYGFAFPVPCVVTDSSGDL